MTLNSLLAIFGMAAVTYAIRAGGLYLAGRLPQHGFVANWLAHVPGAVLAALVAPSVISGGLAEWTASGATALAFVASRNLFVAMVAGIGVVWAIRSVLGT